MDGMGYGDSLTLDNRHPSCGEDEEENWQIVGFLLPVGSFSEKKSSACKEDSEIESKARERDSHPMGFHAPQSALHISPKICVEEEEEAIRSTKDSSEGMKVEMLPGGEAAEINIQSSEYSSLHCKTGETINWSMIDSDLNINPRTILKEKCPQDNVESTDESPGNCKKQKIDSGTLKCDETTDLVTLFENKYDENQTLGEKLFVGTLRDVLQEQRSTANVIETGSDSILEIYLQNQKEETVQADRSCLKSFKRRSLKASTETGTEKGLANSEQTLVKRKVKDAEEQTPAAKRIVKFNSKEKLSSATKKARVDSKKHSCPAIQRERVTAETFDILSSSNLSSRKQTSKCGSVYIVDIYHSLIGARPVESNHKNFNYPEDILPFEGYGLDMHKDLTTIKSKERYEYLRKSKKDNSNSAILTSQTKGSNRNVTLCRDDLSGVDDKAVETSTVRCTLVSKESVEDLQEIFVSGQNEDSCCMEETMKFGENENSALTDKNVRYEESAEICTSENSEEMGLSKSDVDFHGERCSNNNMNNDHDLFLVEDSRSCSEINQNQTSSLCMDIEAEVSNKLFEDKSSDLLQSAIEDEQNYQNEIDSLCCDITVLNHGDSSFEAAIAEARQTAHECDRPYTLNDVGTMCTKTRDQLPATSVCSNKAREKNHSDIFNRSHIFKSSSSSKQVGNKPWNQKLSPSKLSISARQASDLRSYSLSNLVLEAFQVDSTSDFDPKIHKKKVRHLKCMYCPSKFYRRSDLLRHTRRHTGEKPFKCDVCNKTCKTKENLRRHKSTHLGEKFHVCEVCGKAFSRKFDLKRHSVKHSQERPFACDICGNTFTASNDLCKHRKSHTEEKPFKCKTCGLTFVQKGNLKSHMLVHSNCKSFQCDICEKFFSKKSNLKRHRATHSVEAKYTCGICQRAFARSDDLIRHLRVHSGEKPFICMLCGDGFSQQSHLYAHRRRHVLKKKKVTQTAKPQSTKDWKFGIFCQKSNLHGKKLLQSCDLCCKKFTRSYNLNRHRNWHFENSVFSCETCMWVPSVDEQTQDRRKLCIKLKPFVLLHRLSKFCLHADTNVTGKSQTL